MKKFCRFFRDHAKNIIDFEKKHVLPFTKKIKITSGCKGMLHLWKKNLKRAPSKYKLMENFVILQVNTATELILYVI